MVSDRGKQFIQDTEYAVKHLIEGITSAKRELETVQSEIDILEKAAVDWQNDANFWTQSVRIEDSPLAQVYESVSRDKARQAEAKQRDLELAKNSFADQQEALAALCGALLQIAKEGISACHGALKQMPGHGRLLSGIPLAEIIWQGRNQCMHASEGYSKQVLELFAKLENEFGAQFSLNHTPRRSLAYEVTELLGWRDYERYHADLHELL